MLVEGQGGGCHVAIGSQGSPLGQHHSVSLHGGLDSVHVYRTVAVRGSCIPVPHSNKDTPLLELINAIYMYTMTDAVCESVGYF